VTNLQIVFFVAHLTIACLATGVQAATFTVTQGGCAGSGSLRDAIQMANANPGKDTVNFDASVTNIQPTSGSPTCAQPRSIRITESVDILGPGSSKLNISDNVQWLTPSGHVNAGLFCDCGNM
jgi:hypothetical protein